MIRRKIALLLTALLALVSSGCGSTSSVSEQQQPQSVEAFPDGVTQYVVVDDIDKVPFIVIQADSYADDGFDFYLRDELVKVGFPRGVTRAQLGRLYLDAGLGNVAQSVDDPMAMYQLARAVGPFLLLRVTYQMDGWGLTSYEVTVWDAISSRPVFTQNRTKMVWWKLSREIGPPIVAALAQWREDCLEAAQTNGQKKLQSAI